MIELKRGATSVVLDDLGQGLQVARASSAAGSFEFEAGQLFLLRFWHSSGGLIGGPIGDLPLGVDIGPAFPGAHPEQIADLTDDSVTIFYTVRQPVWDLLQLVEVRIWIDETEVVNFTINVRNRAPNIALNLVTFPILRIKSVGDPANNVLATSWQGGGVLRDPAHELRSDNNLFGLPVGPRTFDFIHPGFMSSMQFFAYYLLTGELLYLQTTDGEGFRKDFTISGYDTFTELAHNAWPVNNLRAGNDPDAEAIYQMPYAFQMAVMKGNWYDASRRYRDWALKQEWAQGGPMAKAPDFSQRLRDATIGLLQAAASPFGETPPLGRPFDMNFYVEEMADLERFLGTSAIESGWFHWHTQIFDDEEPEWTPRPSFADALLNAHDHGFGVCPYILTTAWDPGTRFYQEHDGATRAVRGWFGEIPSPAPRPAPPFVNIAPYPSTNRIIVDHFSPIVTRLGADGLYLDAWSGGGVGLDENYEIRRAGGTSEWMKGKRDQTKLFKDAVKAWNGREYAMPRNYLCSEFVEENLIDLIEMVSTAPFIFPPFKEFRPVPMYTTVYHEHQLSVELIGLPDIGSEILVAPYLARIAFVFHNGRMVTLFTIGKNAKLEPKPLLEQVPFPDFWEFIKAFVVRFRDVQRFQRLGERLRPLTGSAEDLFDKVEGVPDPTVQGSVWRSGEDLAVYLSSSAQEPREFAVRLSAPAFPIEGRHGLIEVRPEGRPVLLRLFADSVEQVATIPPLSLVVMEILPEARAVAVTTPLGMSSLGPMSLTFDLSADILSAELVTDGITGLDGGGATFETIVAMIGEGKLTLFVETTNDRGIWSTISTSVKMTAPGTYFWSVPAIGGAWARLRYVFEPDLVEPSEAQHAVFYARLPAPLAIPTA